MRGELAQLSGFAGAVEALEGKEETPHRDRLQGTGRPGGGAAREGR
jgi:hypothetical protein